MNQLKRDSLLFFTPFHLTYITNLTMTECCCKT